MGPSPVLRKASLDFRTWTTRTRVASRGRPTVTVAYDDADDARALAAKRETKRRCVT